MSAEHVDRILELDVPLADGCVDGVCEMPSPPVDNDKKSDLN